MLTISIVIPKYKQNIPNHKILAALFDSGGIVSLIHACILLPDDKPSIGTKQIFTTIAGQFQSQWQVLLQNKVLTEFKCTAYIDNHTCQIFIGPCYYNNILGQDFLQKIHFDIHFKNNAMNCMDMSAPMWSPNYFSE